MFLKWKCKLQSRKDILNAHVQRTQVQNIFKKEREKNILNHQEKDNPIFKKKMKQNFTKKIISKSNKHTEKVLNITSPQENTDKQHKILLPTKMTGF